MRSDAPDLGTTRRTSALGALVAVFEFDQIRTLLPVVILAAGSGRFVLVIAVALIATVVGKLLSWWRRTWSFADGVLVLDEGVFTRNERRIPVHRIQHVEIDQRLRHQAFGLAAVRVETAGGGGAELELDAVSMAEAEALRGSVLATLRSGTGARTDVGGAPAAAPEVLIRLTPRRLLLAGITGPEVAAVLATLAVAVDLFLDLGGDTDTLGEVRTTTLVVTLIVLVAVPLWLATAALVGMVRRWDLTATIDADEIRVSYGLLRRAEFVVKTARIQDVRIARRLLLRPFRRADLRIRTAASGRGDRSRVDIPLLDDAEVARVLARVMPAAVPLPMLVAAPPAARRRAIVRGVAAGVVVALATLTIGIWIGAPTPMAPVAVVPILVGVALGEASYRGLGARGDEGRGMVHARHGALSRHHEVVPIDRVQSGAVESTWFQRRRGLGRVRLDLAGAAVMVHDREQADAESILSTAL